MSEETDGADQENFGSDEELTDIPAFEPAPGDATAIEEAEAAAADAAAIGGHTPSQDLDPAQQAVSEGGEGEAEGFELAEEELIESASHGTPAGNPLGDRMAVEDAASEGLASYGEADHVEVSEDDIDGEDDDN